MSPYERDIVALSAAVTTFAALFVAGAIWSRKKPASSLSYPVTIDRLRHINPDQEV